MKKILTSIIIILILIISSFWIYKKTKIKEKKECKIIFNDSNMSGKTTNIENIQDCSCKNGYKIDQKTKHCILKNNQKNEEKNWGNQKNNIDNNYSYNNNTDKTDEKNKNNYKSDIVENTQLTKHEEKVKIRFQNKEYEFNGNQTKLKKINSNSENKVYLYQHQNGSTTKIELINEGNLKEKEDSVYDCSKYFDCSILGYNNLLNGKIVENNKIKFVSIKKVINKDFKITTDWAINNQKDEFTEKDLELYEKLKNIYNNKNKINEKEKFNIKRDVSKTEWYREYVKNHWDIVNSFWKKDNIKLSKIKKELCFIEKYPKTNIKKTEDGEEIVDYLIIKLKIDENNLVKGLYYDMPFGKDWGTGNFIGQLKNGIIESNYTETIEGITTVKKQKFKLNNNSITVYHDWSEWDTTDTLDVISCNDSEFIKQFSK